MRLRYYLNEATGLPHIYDHGVRESEVEELLHRPGAILPGRKGAKLAVGQTTNGRYLKIGARKTHVG
jgi:hypothetical protein